MADHHRKLGDTVKLVGAMMRLRHNTKFKVRDRRLLRCTLLCSVQQHRLGGAGFEPNDRLGPLYLSSCGLRSCNVMQRNSSYTWLHAG